MGFSEAMQVIKLLPGQCSDPLFFFASFGENEDLGVRVQAGETGIQFPALPQTHCVTLHISTLPAKRCSWPGSADLSLSEGAVCSCCRHLGLGWRLRSCTP